MGKITDNLKKIEFKCQILEKWHHRESLLAKNTKAGRLFCSNFLKQSVTKIKMRQKFSAYREGGPLKKDMTFSSVLNCTKIFLFLVNKVIQNIFLHTEKNAIFIASFRSHTNADALHCTVAD